MIHRSSEFNEIAKLLEKADSALVIAHEHPEGDAIGSTLGLALILKDMGKKVTAYNQDEVPWLFRFLPGQDLLQKEAPDPKQFDLIVVLDCGDLSRVGSFAEKIQAHPNILNIDHHISNDKFGKINLVDSSSSSTGEIICQLGLHNYWPICKNAATCLYCAIYTDTTAFSNDAATPSALHCSAVLMGLGADFIEVAKYVYKTQRLERLLLLGQTLNTLRLTSNGRVAGLIVTEKMMKDTGTKPDDLEGFVELPRNIPGVEASYLLREDSGGARIKASLRTSIAVDAARFAESFKGGGHSRAAGFHISGPIDEARQKIEELLAKELAQT